MNPYKVLILGYDRNEAMMWRCGDEIFPPVELERRLNALAAEGWRITREISVGRMAQLILEKP